MFNSTISFIEQNVSDKGRRQKLIILSMIDLISIFANGFFLLNVCVRMPIRRLESRTYIYFSYVSLTNLAIALFIMPFAVISFASGKWILGSGVCYFNGFMVSFCLTSCIYSITVLSIHKYLTVVWPMTAQATKYQQLFYRIGISILLSFTVSIIPFAESRVYFNTHTGLCAISFVKRKAFYTLFIVLTAYIIPTVINTIIYVRIFKALRKHGKRLSRNSLPNRISIKSQKETMRTLYMTFTLFMIGWTPFFVYAILFLADTKKVSNTFLILAYFCGFLNSMINPFVFIFRNMRIRRSWASIFKKREIPKVSLVPTLSRYDFTSTAEPNFMQYASQINDNEDKSANMKESDMNRNSIFGVENTNSAQARLRIASQVNRGFSKSVTTFIKKDETSF